ncbi:GNAT family N-acetyltransferase [Clostridium pasteurianum]|uniref:Acetyltransferase, ribosomal protein N-acetylase n=1 Tax=Clostridium pasteurianum BC1 TaxID=86416 RepID=R4K1M3_CLOPA|nr:GNAT family N-acetyltransferase [Clostridium pasteurianum]AGK95676.1 acetyltransferase, ribosomal protein N-acetylase [Clostridium pasteurianum BC1]
MIIRKIQIKDSEKFLNMLKQLDTETKYMMFEPEERKTTINEIKTNIKNINISRSLILVAEDTKNVVGFLSAERGFAKRIEHSVYIVIGILKDYRGRKIGLKLFEALEKWALENHIIRLELTVMTNNKAAIGLYKKIGFKIEGLKEKSLIVDGKYVDEYYMGKILL